MSIKSRIQDGAGTIAKPGVFDHRLRELEVQQSATNHISTAQLGGQTGVFTVRNSVSTIVSNANRNRILSISNNDPINQMVIDKVYIQIFSSSITLPNQRLITLLEPKSAANTIPITNQNIFSNIIPVITARGVGTGGSTGDPIILQMFPTLGDINEFILPIADSNIILGLPITTINTISNNSIGISVQNLTGGSVTIGAEAFIKFMMVPPNQLG